MLEGLYSAGAGMEAAQSQLDAVSNNIANEDTPGYQSEVVGFHDLLYTTDDDDPSTAIVGAGVGHRHARLQPDAGFDPADRQSAGPGAQWPRVLPGAPAQRHDRPDPQRHLRAQLTWADHDLAGDGARAADHAAEGHPAFADSRLRPTATVTVAGQKVGQISIVQVTAPDKLLPQGNSVYAATAGSGPVQTAKGVTMQQGYLEQSNVDLDTQISNMETAEQAYNMGSKAVQMEAQLGQIAATLK